MENNKRYDAGIDTMEEMFPEETLNEMKRMKEMSPDLWDMIVSFGFGGLYTRDALPLKRRQIATLSSLITQGAFEQLEVHLRAALKIGLTQKEIVEIIIHLTGYAGFPKAVQAMQMADRIFNEQDEG
ncbi:carboxymuconolactone decarboxylase family protein [Virgibacillus doumboii]|uniref:carboxymuconolactone decarboxylase family protein n=1 Tax=Virgibacillus doumboii TaxID=2697503 RepID=UPI0013E0C09C|nr:carboxymuconolactone decarboxylase family protein [Virgibacillus doumboii]